LVVKESYIPRLNNSFNCYSDYYRPNNSLVLFLRVRNYFICKRIFIWKKFLKIKLGCGNSNRSNSGDIITNGAIQRKIRPHTWQLAEARRIACFRLRPISHFGITTSGKTRHIAAALLQIGS
jgi:hypothetical protein